MSIVEDVRKLYEQYGQQKPMGTPAPTTSRPHYFLLRTFLGENDLIVILNTKRCQHQCHFCQLPVKSSRTWISGEDIQIQFGYVASEVRHSLSLFSTP